MRVLPLVTALALCTGSLVMVTTGASAGAACDADATSHYVDAAHDGSSCAKLSATLTQKWSVTLSGFAAYPVIGSGKVFLTTTVPRPGGPLSGWLYALNASDGSPAWGPIPIATSFWYLTIAYDDGRVFVNTFDGRVTAFDAATGRQEWTRRTENFSSEPVVRDGVLYVQSNDTVFALSETDGAVIWTHRLNDGAGSQLAVDDTGVYIDTGCSQFALSLADGSSLWSQNDSCTGGDAGVSWLGGGRFFERRSGQVLAETTGRTLGSFSGTPAFAGGNAYLANGTALMAEAIRTLTPVFTTTLPKAIMQGPVIANGTVYVVAADKKLYAISTADGHIVQTVALPGAPYVDRFQRNAPADLNIGDGLVIVPTGRTVTAFG